MPEQYKPSAPQPEKTEEAGGTTRRNILRLGLVISASAVGGVALGLAGPRLLRPQYQRIEGGEIIGDSELIRRLTQAEETQQPVRPDSTIITSVAHSVMRYHGVPADQARDAAGRIFTGELANADGAVLLTEDGLTMRLATANFDPPDGPTQKNWSDLVHLIGHEGTHMSTIPDLDGSVTEDYGPLGTVRMSGGIFGFAGNNETFSGPFNLIRPTLPQGHLPNTMEEWVAEAGRINFVRHLRDSGLGGAYVEDVAESRLSCRCHAFLEPSIRLAYDSSQPKTLGHEFSPEWLLAHHLKRERAQAFLRIGASIFEQNPHNRHALPEATTRGLGMLGFSAYVHEQGANTPRTLEALTTADIDDTELIDLAKRHQEFLVATYKK